MYEDETEDKDIKIKVLIEEVLSLNPTYGHKRIAIELKMNKKKVLRLMHKYSLKPYRRRTRRLIKINDIKQPEAIHKNLIKNICPIKPGIVWVEDFTYISFKGMFVYLATVMDIYDRMVKGFNISLAHDAELVVRPIELAIIKYPSPLILHSDQGSEYKSEKHEKLCEKYNIQISMSSKSSPWQNGFQESFYSHFKLQLADPDRFEDLGHLIEEIYIIIHYYNNRRIHSVLKTTPMNFYQNYLEKFSTKLGT